MEKRGHLKLSSCKNLLTHSPPIKLQKVLIIQEDFHEYDGEGGRHLLEEHKCSLRENMSDSDSEDFFEHNESSSSGGTPRFNPEDDLTLTFAKLGEEM